MKTPKQCEEIHVKNDKKVDTVEKYFDQLAFKHQIRLACQVLTKRCIEVGHDAKITTFGRSGSGKEYKFVITVKLDD